MIDVHCHLENEDYSDDRDELIINLKKELKAVITSCAHPKDFDVTRRLVHEYKDFIFCTCSIHPIYIKEISLKEKEEFFRLIKENKDKIAAIGETGLDYYWIKDKKWIEKQKELFRDSIKLSKDLKKPLVIHARESYEDCIEILEEEDAKNVNLHMFGGRRLIERVISNQWHISMNAIVLKSKNHKKIIRDMPMDRIMLETDAPWLSPSGGRNTPLTIKNVAEKISEIKNIRFDEVWRLCGENAVNFFDLPIKL